MQTADAVRETLRAQAAPRLPDGEFFRLVTKRNAGPDGQPRDPTLFRRLGNEICVRCQESYRLKFPGRPFKITCKGIYSQPDFIELAAKTKLTLDEVRDLLDVPYWESRHIKIPNADGDLEYFIARDYQCESLLCTTSRQVDRWGRGNGKAIDVTTPIPTPFGWKTMADLKVGDLIFGADGKPYHVTFATEVMYGRPCYDVVFSDGSILRADGEHQWLTWTKLARKETRRRESRKRV